MEAMDVSRYAEKFSHMPTFLKGKRPNYFDKEPIKIPSKHGGKVMTGANIRTKNGRTGSRKVKINPTKCPGTIMSFGNTCGGESKLKSKHPAVFPNMLAYDMIECFCPPDGVVLDPFNGSGTTTLAAKCLSRNYIGIDVSDEYNAIAEERILTETIYRKKENITELANGSLARITNVRPVTYTLKEEYTNDTSKVYTGFIAHEFQEQFPNSVRGVKDELNEDGSVKLQSIDITSNELLTHLIKSIQEQQAQIQALQQRLDDLEG